MPMKTAPATNAAENATTEAAERLVEAIRPLGSCAVAFSAGVDSAVVLMAARLALGAEHVVAITGVGPALAEGELDEARRVAEAVGVRHVEAPTDEIERQGYVANAPDRCFHCKTELYGKMAPLAEQLGLAAVLNGANADDAGDHRPGMRAADDYGVRSPLLECGIGKATVRAIASHWDLSVWDKPASPCLASRIAYGESVTAEKLARIDAAERRLRSLGLKQVRVRLHPGDVARIEAPLDAIPMLAAEENRVRLVAWFRELGFKAVALDLSGFRSGSLNELVELS
ncbi:hypothetical protein Mal64_03280 [Pseudobythopirellula maris]|uniref:Uncharacterized protein n=1 Tax=Pseudobythopirellula maris TaxID=2527991 RepID=A0A5C5ZRS4_9BACT|nr:ATP-dependent sacrificial sulfur transferase LarE [Pseudobythopirellula maris]TWT89946.1 hypothetical protein Mal64_03280 [Pseudobythopirellula maris]